VSNISALGAELTNHLRMRRSLLSFGRRFQLLLACPPPRLPHRTIPSIFKGLHEIGGIANVIGLGTCEPEYGPSIVRFVGLSVLLVISFVCVAGLEDEMCFVFCKPEWSPPKCE